MTGRGSRWGWALSALFVLYGTTIPFHFVFDVPLALQKLGTVPLNPLVSAVTGGRISRTDFIQNVLLFLPFGLFGVMAGPRPSSIQRVLVVGLLGAVLSLSVETLQLFTADRTSSLSDTLANAVGALVGGLAAWAASDLIGRAAAWLRDQGARSTTALVPLIVAAVIVATAAWEPFDVTLDVGSIWPRLKAFATDPWQGGAISDEVLQLVRYALLTCTFAAWLREVGRKRPMLDAAIASALLGIGLEGTQIFVTSRMPGLRDAMVNVVGALAGALVYAAYVRHPDRRLWGTAFILSTAIGGAVQMLSPFVMSPSHSGFRWMPFLGYYEHTTSETMSHVHELALIGLPMGLALAAMGLRRRVALFGTALVVSLLVGLGIEYGQGWIVGRYPDVTDAGLVAAAGMLGAWIGRAAVRSEPEREAPEREALSLER